MAFLCLPETARIAFYVTAWNEELYEAYTALLSRDENGDSTQLRITSASLHFSDSVALKCWPTFQPLDEISARRSPKQELLDACSFKIDTFCESKEPLKIWPPSFSSNLESFSLHALVGEPWDTGPPALEDAWRENLTSMINLRELSIGGWGERTLARILKSEPILPKLEVLHVTRLAYDSKKYATNASAELSEASRTWLLARACKRKSRWSSPS